MELGSLGDGTTPGHLEAWYNRAIELKQQYLESERFYGKKRFGMTTNKQDQAKSNQKPKLLW